MPDLDRTPRSIYIELLAVVGLFAIPSLLLGLGFFFDGEGSGTPTQELWSNATLCVQMLLFILLFFCILRLNGETLQDFTKPLQRNDMYWAFGLALAGFIAELIIIRAAIEPAPADAEPAPVIAVPFTIYFGMLISPFCEEFLVRGFLQTRLRQAGWNGILAALFAAALQTSYHIYQGVVFMIAVGASFLMFALFYHFTRRLWPVVLAHLLLNLLVIFAMM